MRPPDLAAFYRRLRPGDGELYIARQAEEFAMKRSIPLDQPNDRPAMKQAVAWFRTKRLKVVRHTSHQLKYGLINFYPERGTISVDQLGTLTRKGLEVVQALLENPHATYKEIKTICKELNLLPSDDDDNGISLGIDLDP